MTEATLRKTLTYVKLLSCRSLHNNKLCRYVTFIYTINLLSQKHDSPLLLQGYERNNSRAVVLIVMTVVVGSLEIILKQLSNLKVWHPRCVRSIIQTCSVWCDVTP